MRFAALHSNDLRGIISLRKILWQHLMDGGMIIYGERL